MEIYGFFAGSPVGTMNTSPFKTSAAKGSDYITDTIAVTIRTIARFSAFRVGIKKLHSFIKEFL